MKIEYVEGDIFNFVKNSYDSIIIPHVCNDIALFGAGFVVPLGRNFPTVRDEYLKWSRSNDKRFTLGEIQTVQIDNVCVINMIAQHGVGGKRPLNYAALGKCLFSVRDFVKSNFSGSIHAPMFGSGLGGGKWDFIEEMINDAWIDYGIPVKIYYLPGKTPLDWIPPKN